MSTPAKLVRRNTLPHTPMTVEPPFVWPTSILPHKAAQHEAEKSAAGSKDEDLVAAVMTHDGDIDYVKLALNAPVYDVCKETPLTFASKLSARLNNKIFLKREDLQPIFSFKCRGAYTKMYQLTAAERARGVCCVSAGNHAQGVALAAGKLGISATIVMPLFAPEIKVDNVRRLGANVVLFGNDFDEAKKECARLATERNLIFVPPFDDPYVIAGQATVGVEILRQIRQERLDAIFVCCGGGGLIAGISAYVKRIRPEVRVIGVNTYDSDGMYQSLLKGEPVEIKEAGLFSDGTSVRLPGKECVRLALKHVDDMVLVSNDEICAAIKDTFDDTRSILEPAGALGLAGLKKYLSANADLRDGVFVAVSSGANMNFDRLRFVAERAKIGEGREALLSVLVPEHPGSLRQLYNVVYPRFVTELSYRFSELNQAHIFLAFEVADKAVDIPAVISAIAAQGPEWKAVDISDNEMAKTHGRFLAGGRSSTVRDEVVYRFMFPDRPGSLRRFLDLLETGAYNVSLFHYRNNGADVGRVLAGLQVPPEQKGSFGNFVSDLRGAGYINIVEETENPVYKHFLC
ncbi:tryptophan synthase beta subunit-like PLP-dependent enzyme [Entophlyctis helioformis]|nr:tryptophan synthase beta subunit-like PLP-dependent enzyme [Entophlyctis helioformis]